MRVNFSAVHNTYYSAYKYTTKEDDFCVHSEGHPDLSNACPARTEKVMSGKKRKAVGRTGVRKRNESVVFQCTRLPSLSRLRT